MRRLATGALACVLAVGIGGCGDTGTGRLEAAIPSPTPPPPATSAPAPTTQPVDLVPTLTNPAGYPPCGFYTWVEDFFGQKVTQLMLAVAATVTGAPEAGLLYTVDGDQYKSATFRDGELVQGSSWSPPGASFRYLTVRQGPIPGVGSPHLTQTTSIVVEVDPANRVAESNEANNKLTLRVKPTKRQNIAITDNVCTVVR